MSFTLSIDADRWRAHQASVVTAVSATGAGEIVPVSALWPKRRRDLI
jgi:hypothetical protein